MFVFADLDSSSQKLIFTQKSGQKLTWELAKWGTNLKVGLGYLQELRGRFGERERLQGMHGDGAKDFEIVCGRYPVGLHQRNGSGTKPFFQTNSGFPRPIGDNIIIRVFAEPPPTTVKRDIGTIWVTDPGHVILTNLLESASRLSYDLDEGHDVPGAVKEVPDPSWKPSWGDHGVAWIRSMKTMFLVPPVPFPPMVKVQTYVRYFLRRRVIMGVPFRIR